MWVLQEMQSHLTIWMAKMCSSNKDTIFKKGVRSIILNAILRISGKHTKEERKQKELLLLFKQPLSMSLYFYFFHFFYSFLHRFSHSRHSIFILPLLLVLLHKPAASILEPPHKPFWWLQNIPSHQVLSFTWKVSISWFFSSFLFSVISDIKMIHFVSTSVYS